MPASLAHSPADVISRALIAQSLGSEPGDSTAWPVRVANEPSTPDNAITVFDTLGTDGGREMVAGERAEHHGFQVRIRSTTHAVGYAKARAIAVALDAMRLLEVDCDGTLYVIWSISRTTDVIALGKDRPASERSAFTVNATVSVRQA